MDRGRVGEDRGSKETDGCPLTETGGGGVMFLATSWLPMITINLFNVSFMAQVASACSLSLFSICWNLSLSMAGESMTIDDCYRGGTGGGRL
jgi:hypothetical protein